MSFDDPISFDDAVDDAAGWGARPALLVGNGLSIAWAPDRFSYRSLFDGIRASLATEIRKIFRRYGTVDFEAVMLLMEDARSIAKIYAAPIVYQRALRRDIRRMRRALVRAVHLHHPHDATALTLSQRRFGRTFLLNFDEVFTTNYDLLLYWTINSDITLQNRFRDGFGRHGPGMPLTWSKPRSQQTMHYLHGALHYVLDGSTLTKYQWTGAGQPIMGEVEELLDSGRSPLIVAEGRSSRKVERIEKHKYLRRCLYALGHLDVPLFVHGFAFADQDVHIRNAIAASRCPEIYVALYNGRNRVRDQVEKMVQARNKLRRRLVTFPTLRVTWYDAASAKPWGC